MTDTVTGCAKTPLSDLLRRIPQEAVYSWTNPEESRKLWQLGSESAPIGRLAHEAADALDAMLAASPQGEGSSAVAWRDIATAPRDGREIVAYSQDVSGTTGLNPFVSLCAWHPDAGFCTCELREVTHWMPLPPPPSADPAPIKPSADTGELRERVARVVYIAIRDFEDDKAGDWETAKINANVMGKAIDAILAASPQREGSSPVSPLDEWARTPEGRARLSRAVAEANEALATPLLNGRSDAMRRPKLYPSNPKAPPPKKEAMLSISSKLAQPDALPGDLRERVAAVIYDLVLDDEDGDVTGVGAATEAILDLIQSEKG